MAKRRDPDRQVGTNFLLRRSQRLTGDFESGAVLDDLLICPHDETDGCPCCKPKAGLLREAAFNWHLNLDRAFVISDKWQDAEAAHQAGCTSVMIRSPWLGSVHHELVLPNLESAVERIIQLHSVSGPVFV